VTYSGIPVGDYVFTISSTYDGLHYSPELTLPIYISPPFWKTNWFVISLLLVGVIFIAGLIILQTRKSRKKAEIEKTILALRSTALMAQLNPHLIFNILGSIQGLVSSSNVEDSNRYISKFSKFLRHTLEFSKRSSVSLKEEIEMTKIYMELEMLRFGDNLKISIDDCSVSSNVLVSPLILQPFIENAIKHGVMPLKGLQGEIKVIIHDLEDSILISIQDNGVGFKNSPNIGSGNGIRISEERLTLLDERNTIKVVSEDAPTEIQLKIYK